MKRLCLFMMLSISLNFFSHGDLNNQLMERPLLSPLKEENADPIRRKNWALIAEEIGLKAEELTYEDLLRVEKLDLEDKGIEKLSGFDLLKNLKSLNLSNNKIVDISLLSTLINLEELYLEGNKLKDISTLTLLTNLKTLVISQDKITNLEGLPALKKNKLLKVIMPKNEYDSTNIEQGSYGYLSAGHIISVGALLSIMYITSKNLILPSLYIMYNYNAHKKRRIISTKENKPDTKQHEMVARSILNQMKSLTKTIGTKQERLSLAKRLNDLAQRISPQKGVNQLVKIANHLSTLSQTTFETSIKLLKNLQNLYQQRNDLKSADKLLRYTGESIAEFN